jgi:enamine deaminase RidA (YjgF/YER057c/UK114 family)
VSTPEPHAEQRLAELGLSLPPVTPPTGTFEPARHWGELVFVSGHAAWEDGRFLVGTVGQDLDVAAARRAAVASTLCCLAALKAELGDLAHVAGFVKVLGMIRASPEFTEHPVVMDGCSELLVAVFGDRGRHSRAAVGMTSLPFGTAIEIEMTVAVEPATPPAVLRSRANAASATSSSQSAMRDRPVVRSSCSGPDKGEC